MTHNETLSARWGELEDSVIFMLSDRLCVADLTILTKVKLFSQGLADFIINDPRISKELHFR